MDPEIEKKLTSGEYSISPRSGRIRKRVRYRKKSTPFSKRKLKRYGETAIWIVLIVAFLISLIIVIPELNLESEKNIKAKKARSNE